MLGWLSRGSTAGVGALLVSALFAAPADASTARIETTAAGTVLTVQLPEGTYPHLFSLHEPERLVLDLEPYWLDRPPEPAGVVRAVRVAPRDRHGVRIVLELSRPSNPTQALERVSSSQRRLVVTLPAAATEPAVVRALPPASTARDLVIAVDAGHGGHDPGAIGHGGTREKDVALAIARALAQRIDQEPGLRAVLTRSGDEFVKLGNRILRAKAAQADLFVSVHADSVADRTVSGAAVYVLSAHGASSEAARELADRENAADFVGGVSLRNKDPVVASVLFDLAQSASMSASRVAGERVLTALDGIGDLKRSQVQQAGFVVLKSPDIPSMLVETACITNATEERELADPRHQARIAEAILAGINSYFRDYAPAGTRLFAHSAASADRETATR
jgi:N-acetylmuramoyl-L-alanine amidase